MAKLPSQSNAHLPRFDTLRKGAATLVPMTPEQALELKYIDDVIAALYDKPFQCMLKRVMDIGFTLLGMTIVLPIILLVALAIKLDSPGPAFFAQVRIGKNGRPFRMYKLRSMVINAAEQRDALEYMNETNGVIFKIKSDPRITRVGKFIRKYSIDELPQLFNVLKGEMSLVGPRPLPLENVEKFAKHHLNRFKVPQGVTGVWQVFGRSDLQDFEEIYQMEHEYIEHWSLIQDITLIIKTFSVVFTGKGAC
jgi:lipopolysaccharide/colanic/teichoic acid biosynthesis glycosyltransferase